MTNPATVLSPATVSAADFKQAMRNTAASVNVITCQGKDGDYGITATAFTSVTADPPTVLICINGGSSIYPHLVEKKSFCVNVLNAGAEDIANDFAGRLPAAERFKPHHWQRLASGNPAFTNTSAGFDCRITELSHIGTHLVAIAEVVESWANEEESSLLYSKGNYGNFAAR